MTQEWTGNSVHWVVQLRSLLAESAQISTSSIEPGLDVIDLSIGQPDGEPPTAAVTALAGQPQGLHSYAPSAGRHDVRQVIANWCNGTFGLQTAADDILVHHGAKLAVALAVRAFSEAGDTVVVPTPGYPTYWMSAQHSGRRLRWLPLAFEEDYLPSRASLHTAFEGAAMAFLNYPCNPTGSVASTEFFEQVVDIAADTGTVVVHDAAYSALCHQDRPTSLMQVPGAAEVAIEIHSFSKMYNLAGYRIAFTIGKCGSDSLLRRLERTLQLHDTGASQLAQCAAVAAMQAEPDFAAKRRPRDEARTRQMAHGLRDLGCRVSEPKGAFYVWFKPPEGKAGWERIVTEAGVACAPGHAFGPEGEGYIRFSCTASQSELDEALLRLAQLWM